MSISHIEHSFDQVITELRTATDARRWRFLQGEADGAQAVDWDDSEWPEIAEQTTWAGANGDAWFRRTFSFPESLYGVPTQGARIELPIMVPIHSQVYVDGVERVAEPSWLDTKATPLVLAESYEPGQTIQVTVHAHRGDGFGLFIIDHVHVSSLEERLFTLCVARGQLRFTHHLAFNSPSASSRWQTLWHKAAAKLDTQSLGRFDWLAWDLSMEQARQVLMPMNGKAKSYSAHLVGHSHIDMNWLWPWSETVEVIRRDFCSADKLMERYPDFRFSQSQASVYEAMEIEYPELLERVKGRVAEGKWEVTASTWVEGDLNMACGESLVRQMLLTRPYIQEQFQVRPRICWEPDTFGHTATLPQLLKQAGVDYYYHCRAGQGQPLFWWEGLDGSRVLSFNDPLGYNGVIQPDSIVTPVLDLATRYGSRVGLFLYGVGDHGGGATAGDIEAARRLDETPLLPRAQMSDLVSFYEKAERCGQALPVIRGELNTTFEGCYTTHADIKRLNRSGENSLLTAETAATLARLCDSPVADALLPDLWRTLLFHHFHDILCGCSIGVTYRLAAEQLEPTIEAARSMTAEGVRALASKLDTGQGTGRRIVVWNPLAWSRTDIVRLPWENSEPIPAALVDEDGHVIPTQRDGQYLIFVARNVPSLGCRVYGPTEDLACSSLEAEGLALRNELLSLRVNERSGAIDSLVDLEHERVVDTMSSWRGVERKQNAGLINRLQILWEEPHPMSAWNIGDITRTESLISGAEVSLVENGPVRAVIQIVHRPLHSTVTQRYCLYEDMRRIDIETDIDWHERGGKDVDAPMLRATFKPSLGPSTATFEVPFAGLERAASGDELPALRWADVSDEEYGLSLLNNAKYGHQAHGTTLGLTLVRTAYEPDNLPDQGAQSFVYALYPHQGNWQQAHTGRRAAELNQPLQTTITDGHPGREASNTSWLTCEPSNVIVTAVKTAEDGSDAVVIRLVEMHGHAAQARLEWAMQAARVELVNILEEPIRVLPAMTSGCRVELDAHKVVTLKIHLAKDPE